MSYTKSQRARDWLFIFDTPEGRRAISALLDDCGIFKPAFDPNPQIAAFNEGRRNVALDIVQALAIPPESFQKLSDAMKENIQDD